MTHTERILLCIYVLPTTYSLFYLSRVVFRLRDELITLRSEFLRAVCERLFDRIDEERAGE